MSRFAKTLALAAFVAAPLAHADTDAAPTHPDRSHYYLGVGMFDSMMNINLEAVTRAGNFMLRVGQFQSINEGLGANVSWRKPLSGGDANDSGYFVGLFAGQVAGDNIGSKTFQRNGGGGELGYHWVSDYTRKELTVGLGAAQQENYAGKTIEAAPTVFFDFVVSLGL
jgi:hypothetical protein